MTNQPAKKDLNASGLLNSLTDRALMMIILALLATLAGINLFVAQENQSKESLEPAAIKLDSAGEINSQSKENSMVTNTSAQSNDQS